MPKKRNQGKHGRPTYNQAAKIIARFGGEANLARLIGVSRIAPYRWQYVRPYGSDGLIPSEHIEKIKGVARLEGVLIRPEDWVPEVIRYNEDGSVWRRTHSGPTLYGHLKPQSEQQQPEVSIPQQGAACTVTSPAPSLSTE